MRKSKINVELLRKFCAGRCERKKRGEEKERQRDYEQHDSKYCKKDENEPAIA